MMTQSVISPQLLPHEVAVPTQSCLCLVVFVCPFADATTADTPPPTTKTYTTNIYIGIIGIVPAAAVGLWLARCRHRIGCGRKRTSDSMSEVVVALSDDSSQKQNG